MCMHYSTSESKVPRTWWQLQRQAVLQVPALPKPCLNVPLRQLATLLHQNHWVQELRKPIHKAAQYISMRFLSVE